MTNHHATIYSNGIADFRRYYAVAPAQATGISIPVKRGHLADVLASLNVYGPVTLSSPPSFRPANDLEGNLEISPEDSLEALLIRLSGAEIEVEKSGGTVSGTLMGLHTEPAATTGEPFQRPFLVLSGPGGIRKIPLQELDSLRFLDAAVAAEIDKALQANFQSIKPNSTFVELAVSTTEESAEAVVQYTIPAAAWKISYRLRSRDAGGFTLQGFAIVDNNTDEDWQDFTISVVTGEPITFSTDLADSKTPRRRHVNVVRDEALGAVEVEEESYDYAAACETPMAMAAPMARAKRVDGLEFGDSRSSSDSMANLAEMPTAVVQEVGDFSIFQSPTPVSIGANRSAVIPVFVCDLDDAETVLHYKAENHPERPYRSVQFRNQTGFSLGRGVCTVFEGGAYAGSCILPATRPDAESLLPHALETGVRVRCDRKRRHTKEVGLRLAHGVVYTSQRVTETTVYQIKNLREETCQLVLDHDYRLAEPELQCLLKRDATEQEVTPSKALENGFRWSTELVPSGECTLSVQESRIMRSTVQLIPVRGDQARIDVTWLERQLAAANGPLANHAAVQNCLAIHRKLEAVQHDIDKAHKEIERLATRQERLRKNIAAGGQDDQTRAWKTQLGEAEKKIVTLEDNVIPKLVQEQDEIQNELRSAVTGLAVEWSES